MLQETLQVSTLYGSPWFLNIHKILPLCTLNTSRMERALEKQSSASRSNKWIAPWGLTRVIFLQNSVLLHQSPLSLTCTNPTPSLLLALPISPCSHSEPSLITPCCFHANQLAPKKHRKAKPYLPYSLEMEAQDNHWPAFPLPSQVQEICKEMLSFISASSIPPSNHCCKCPVSVKVTAESRDQHTT